MNTVIKVARELHKSTGKNLFDMSVFNGELQPDGYYKCYSSQQEIWINDSEKSGSLYIKYDLLEKNNKVFFSALYSDGSKDNYYIWALEKNEIITNPNKTLVNISQSYGSGGYFYIKDVIFSWVDIPYEPYGKTTKYLPRHLLNRRSVIFE